MGVVNFVSIRVINKWEQSPLLGSLAVTVRYGPTVVSAGWMA